MLQMSIVLSMAVMYLVIASIFRFTIDDVYRLAPTLYPAMGVVLTVLFGIIIEGMTRKLLKSKMWPCLKFILMF